MKLFTTFLMLAIISARTMAQGEESTPNDATSTTDATSPSSTPDQPTSGVSTDGTTTVSSSSEASVDTTVSSEGTTPSDAPTTTAATTAPTTATTTATTTAPTTAPTTAGTTNPPNSETTAAPTTPNVNPLQCFSCADNDCNEKVVIQCAQKAAGPASLAFLLRSISRADEANVTAYACYSIKVTENDTKIDKLGCIGIPENESACEAVRKELQLTTDDASDECKACQTDECNSGTMAKLSVVTLLCLMLVKNFL